MLPQRARPHSAQRGRPSPLRRADESAGKRSHRNHSSSPERAGFYSRYFLVPQKDVSLRPILDLRLLNYALMKSSFRMITLKQILLQICPGDRFMSLDLKDAYFHIQVAPIYRRFLRLAFERVAYQYKVLPFGLCLAPRTFIQCMDAALSPLRQNPHTQLPRRLAHSGPIAGGFDIAQDPPPPQPLRLPGAQGQLCQDYTVTQPTSFFPGHSYCLGEASHDNSAPRGLKAFQKMLGLMAASSPGTSIGSASHVTHPVLAVAEGSIRGLTSQTPPHNGDSGLYISPGPMDGPLLAKERRDPIHGTQKEGCHDRRFQQGLWSAMRGQTDLRLLVFEEESVLHINIHKSPGRPCLEATLHAGKCVGSEQSALTEGACAGQI